MSHYEPQEWLRRNPAAPAFPTLLDEQSWNRVVRTVNQRPSNAVDLFSGKGGWVGTAWDPTPWGGIERGKFVDTDTGEFFYPPIRLSVLTPGDVRDARCVPQGGNAARTIGIWLRERVTGDADLLRFRERSDPYADLPGRRQPPVPHPDEGSFRAGVQRLSRQRMRVRSFAAAGVLGAIEYVSTMTTDLWTALAMGGGAVIGAATPFVAGRLGRRLSRPLTLASPEDPRFKIAAVLQFYLAHAAQLGHRADSLILVSWRLLYHAAGADSRSEAAMTDLGHRAGELVDQAYAVAQLLEAQDEVEREAARPRVTAIEQQEDEAAIAALSDAPDTTAIAELTQEVQLDTEARRAAAERLRGTL